MVRTDLREWLGGDVTDPTRTCSVCGGEWTALWVGASTLHICRRCAIEILPRIIADATWRSHLHLEDAERVLEEIQKEFWRVIALHALKQTRDVR